MNTSTDLTPAVLDFPGEILVKFDVNQEQTSEYLEIMKFGETPIYMNQDTFFYFFIMMFVGILIFRTLSKAIELPFKAGINIYNLKLTKKGKK